MVEETPARYWLRLDHQGLEMPLPAVYVPRACLPATWPFEHHFVDVIGRDEKADLPVIAGLALDITDPAGGHLVAVETTPDAKNGARTLTASSVTEVASGYYADPSTRAWREQAYTGGLIIIVIGRTPGHPSATPYEVLFSPGSRMGVLPLVAPGPQ